MLTLVTDRSAGRSGLAVFKDGAAVCVKKWEAEPSRAPEWLAETGQALADAGIEMGDIGRFICGLGPGSFSGIRACLSALQGMALPGERPVCGLASAAALALGQAQGAEAVTVVGDARRGRVWCVTYMVDRAAARVRMADGSLPGHTGDDFTLTTAGELAGAVPDGTRIVSPEWTRLGHVLAEAFPEERLVRQDVFPDVIDLGRLALSEPDACVREPMPIYLHPAVAAGTIKLEVRS
ncbi:MAG: tRNA (adenosine(37)-N6)-threonylcarbamoyltransferase complex dimerization subunit type 1 TsaB [Kiritimatiellae bacterium]|nr:tRNA (adenosine(37)-N6)-threonylcarbamoyltransferase complex dimerization subunit type 1 TsaB [Kiritimatiellia bacterium]